MLLLLVYEFSLQREKLGSASDLLLSDVLGSTLAEEERVRSLRLEKLMIPGMNGIDTIQKTLDCWIWKCNSEICIGSMTCRPMKANMHYASTVQCIQWSRDCSLIQCFNLTLSQYLNWFQCLRRIAIIYMARWSLIVGPRSGLDILNSTCLSDIQVMMLGLTEGCINGSDIFRT